MNIRKKVVTNIAYIAVVIGIFLMVIQPFNGITGAAIDLSEVVAKVWFFIGLGMVIGGTALLMVRRGEKYAPGLEDVLTNRVIKDKHAVMIIDTSGVIPNKREFNSDVNKYPGKIYLPKRVLWELKKNPSNEYLTNRIEEEIREKSLLQSPYSGKKYKNIRNRAIGLLGETQKHKNYLGMKHKIETGKWPLGATKYEIEDYHEKLESIKSRLRKKGKGDSDEDVLQEIKEHERVTKGDADVLTTALYVASQGKKAKVFARDVHLQQAINRLRQGTPDLKDFLEYIEVEEAA